MISQGRKCALDLEERNQRFGPANRKRFCESDNLKVVEHNLLYTLREILTVTLLQDRVNNKISSPKMTIMPKMMNPNSGQFLGIWHTDSLCGGEFPPCTRDTGVTGLEASSLAHVPERLALLTFAKSIPFSFLNLFSRDGFGPPRQAGGYKHSQTPFSSGPHAGLQNFPPTKHRPKCRPSSALVATRPSYWAGLASPLRRIKISIVQVRSTPHSSGLSHLRSTMCSRRFSLCIPYWANFA